MVRTLLPLILLVVPCCGCGTTTSDPKATSQNAEHATNTLTTPAAEADRSPIADANEDETDGLTSPSDDQDQYVSFSAVGVKLLRPDGFDDAENFHGFQQPSTQASVMVLMLPGPFSEVTGGFAAEPLKTRGMTLGSKENVEIDGNTGVLLSVTQTAYGIEFAKWIVAFGNEKETRMVTATFPKAHEATLSAQLKSVVLSTKLDSTPPPTPGADVGFTIAASDKLKLTRGVGKMIVYTKDGVIPAKSPEDPLFVAAPSISEVPIQDKRQFSVQRLFQTAHTKISSVTATNAITIDGLDGYELAADAEDADSGTPLVVYQVILFDEGSYFLMQGLVGAKVSAEYLPEFKAMARSLTRKQK